MVNQREYIREEKMQRDKERTATALSTNQVVNRYGSANAEFIKGLTGVDNETGRKFAKSLKGISKGKVNPDYTTQNIKQQAGYSAEVAATARDNAEAIIGDSEVRFSRSDDLAQYGKNHNVVDRVQIQNGKIIEGSQSQMKFLNNRDQLFKKIAEDTKSGEAEFSRYRGVKLEIPSEQFSGAAEFCKNRAQELREQAEKAAKRGAPPAVIERLRRNAKNYDQLAENVIDSGLTTKDAIFYREHPKIATAMDIARTSHRAGIKGAGYAGVIGGSISLLTNAFSVAQEKKQLGEAMLGVATDAGRATALGYSTAYAGSALKGSLQQCSNTSLRTLARTNAPTLAVNICLSLGSSIKGYVAGEITEAQFLNEVGEKGAGMLSSSMMAALGQLAIPIPFVGAAVGGMIGYTLSSFFYKSALEAAHGVELSRQELGRIRAIALAARDRISEEQAALDEFTRRELPQLCEETEHLFCIVSSNGVYNVDEMSDAINEYATLLGKKLQIRTRAEFEDFMSSDQPLTL